MAAKKKSTPGAKPPTPGASAAAKNKKYLDQGTRTALSKVDYVGLGKMMRDASTKKRIAKAALPKKSSEGPKRSGAVGKKARPGRGAR